MTDRKPVQLPPGVARQGSQAEMQGRWYMSQLVRWVEGVLRPVGGWERLIPSAPIVGTIRAMHVWVTRSGIRYIGILTESNLYVMDKAGFVTDISPTPALATPENPTIGGYGDYTYSYSTYDTPRPTKQATIGIGPTWTLDNFGDDLIAMASPDGRLLRWKSAVVGAKAEEIVEAPKGRFFVVTPERHVMMFNLEGKFNQFGWSSQEDILDWAFTSITNTAGSYDIEPAAPFLTAVPTRFGVLAFTTTGAYQIRYLGVPYIYSYEFLGAHAAPVAGGAIQQTADRVYWYASDGFWTFDGQAISTVKCEVLDWIQRTIDPIEQYNLTTAIFLGVQSEVWFFFPEKGQKINTRYVIYNFDEKWWSMGRLTRTCGYPGSALSYPLMSDGQNIYQHEKGLFYYDAPELPYAQSGGIQVADGARQLTMRKGIVDTRAPADDVLFTIAARKDRITDGTEKKRSTGARKVRPNGGKLDFRVTGRELTIRIASSRSGVEPWTFGKMLVYVAARGGR